MAPPSDKNESYVAYLKEQSIQKKRWKPRRNRAINGNAVLVRTMRPSNARCSGLRAWPTNKKKTNTTFSHLQPARIVRSYPNFAWW